MEAAAESEGAQAGASRAAAEHRSCAATAVLALCICTSHTLHRKASSLRQ